MSESVARVFIDFAIVRQFSRRRCRTCLSRGQLLYSAAPAASARKRRDKGDSAGVAELADARDSKSPPIDAGAEVTSDAQRQAQRPDSSGDELAARLAKLPPEQFDALAPRIAKLNREDAAALLDLMGV